MQVIYKQVGETPLACAKRHEIAQPFTYAGRLDPLAEGLLLILEGEECRERGRYLGLSKTYEYEIVVGISTDTHDMLGYIEKASVPTRAFPLKACVEGYRGKHALPYPSYSSKTVNGKPLFTHARNETLSTIEIPIRSFEILSHRWVSQTMVSGAVIADRAVRAIRKVTGDFRQEESVRKWKVLGNMYTNSQFICMRAVMRCSSGTYVRSVVTDLERQIGYPTLVYSIKRTALGNITKPT